MRLIWDKTKALDVADFYSAVDDYLFTKSESTRGTYTVDFRQFAKFLGYEWGTEEAAKAFIAATTRDVYKFLHELQERTGYSSRVEDVSDTLSNNTIRNRIVVLRGLYNHLLHLKLIQANPWPDSLPQFIAHPIQKQPTALVPFEKVKEMLQVPNQNTPDGLRDACMLSLLFGLGLRASEICRLKLGHFKRDSNGRLYVSMLKTKGAKLENKAIPDFALNTVEKYLQKRESEGAKESSHLLVKYCLKDYSILGDLTYKVLHSKFKKYCSAVGLNPKDYSPHAARATAITKLLSDGFTHREVQEFSGHASVRTVELYDKRAFSVEKSIGKKLKY